MPSKFEEFMECIYVEDGNKDMDLFHDWLQDLPIENIIMYADKFAEQRYKTGYAVASNKALETIRGMK